MSRDWYIVYTSNRKEKKVVTALNQKKIKNYFPSNILKSADSSGPQVTKKALFKTYVFVYITEAEINLVKQIPGVIHFLHWLDKPAIIQNEEIEAIQQISTTYSNISIEKSAVNRQNKAVIIEDTVFSSKGNSVNRKLHTLTVVLPTMGYTLKAEREAGKALFLEEKQHDWVDTVNNTPSYLQ